MKKGLVVALVVAIAGVAGLAQASASDSHEVVFEVRGVYSIKVTRPGQVTNDVHILLDIDQPVMDDTSRLSYFLNRTGPNGTRIWVAAHTPDDTSWLSAWIEPSWAGPKPPNRHHIVGKIKITPPVEEEVLLKIEPGADLGLFNEAIILAYYGEIIDPSVPAGTKVVFTISYTIEDIPFP